MTGKIPIMTLTHNDYRRQRITSTIDIHSFIHSENLYSSPSGNFSEALPAQPRLKKKRLERLVEL